MNVVWSKALVGFLAGSVACFAIACAEGTSQPLSTGAGAGGSRGEGGRAGGDGGAHDGGGSSRSSSSARTSASANGTGGGSGGSGEGGIDPTSCGDGVCDAGENCATCPNDCPDNCEPICGDGFCNGSETCSTCPDDCNECSENCGNGVCDAAEAQTCPQDCDAQSGSTGGGVCPPNPCQAGGSIDATCLDDCALYACIFDAACCEGAWTQSCADAAVLAFDFGFCASCP